jgi:polysaccharide export outer membrane protein
VGCSIVRQEPIDSVGKNAFLPAVSFSQANLSTAKDPPSNKDSLEPIVGPSLNTGSSSPTQATKRNSKVVLASQPTPPNPDEINLIGKNLLASLEKNALENALVAQVPSGTAETVAAQPEEGSGVLPDPWADPPQTPQTPTAGSAPKVEDASNVSQFPGNRPWDQPTIPTPGLLPEPEDFPLEVPLPVGNDTMTVADDEGSYRLGSGDGVDITVWEMPELSRALVIRPDGFISFPLIREIRAAGKTPSELEKIFEEKLSEHLIEPEVNVVVTSVGSKSFYVFGAVGNPGVYPHFRHTTLLQGIISAGGFPSVLRSGQPVNHGDLSRIRIIRTTEQGREIITKNLKGLRDQEILAQDIPIQPEDIIYVPQEAKLVYVFGEVLQPGVVPITDDTRILEVLLNTGGVRATAKRDQIILIRPGTGIPTYACVNMKEIERGALSSNLMVQNGDIIYVPQKFIAKVAEFVQLYSSAIQPALETYLTSWDAWFVHERFSALRRNDFGMNDNTTISVQPNPDP